MSMLIPGDKPDFRSRPLPSPPGTMESPPSIFPGLQIFRWAILFVAGYMLYGAMILAAILFMAAIDQPGSGGVLGVFRHSETWLVMIPWIAYLVGAILLNRRRHLAAWFLLGGAAIRLIPALQHTSFSIWTVAVIGVPAYVAITLLRQPDVRSVSPAAPIRILSNLDFWSRRTLAIVSAVYAVFSVYQYIAHTPPIHFPIWILILPAVVVVTTVIPMGSYLLAIRLIPDDRRNAVVLLVIGIGINLLVALAGTRAHLAIAPLTVLTPTIIAVLQSRQRQHDAP